MARKMRRLAAVALIAGSGMAGIAATHQPQQAHADFGRCFWTTPAQATALGYDIFHDLGYVVAYRYVNGVLVYVELCTHSTL